jgi:starch-binding outer membrane protein, SusD/RagB family
MKTYIRRSLSIAAVGLIALHVQACDQIVAVDNPNNLETDAIDPGRDATLLSQSVYQNFTQALSNLPIYEAWFTNRARVGDTFPTRNEVGRRDISNTNGTMTPFWNNLHEAIQFARTAINSTQDAGPTVDLERNWFASAFGILKQAELYCDGTIAASTSEPRGKMTTDALLDSAIHDLKMVQEIGAKVTGNTEAANMSMAAQVGIARALLQGGHNAEASAEAAKVPADFRYDLIRIDNSSTRNLGNQVWSFSEARISLVVGPEFRAMADSGDPRIAYVDAGRLSQDGVLEFFRQDKYKGWGDFERFASGLEARYIKVEADADAGAMLAFINERRAVGNQPAFGATTDPNALMKELMVQRARDFWLEGHDMADFRRHPDLDSYILQPGADSYYKPELGPVQSQTCWPVPFTELINNPNWNG